MAAVSVATSLLINAMLAERYSGQVNVKKEIGVRTVDEDWNVREKAGLVSCDDFKCQAKEEPETLEEYKLALEHWQGHSWLSGCSHAC